jgi:hypothetical protein
MKQIPLFLIIIICISCSKDKEPCPDGSNYGKLPSCVDGYFFDHNNYWVYQETSTLQLDSVYVTNRNFSQFYHQCWVTENYTLDMQSSIQGSIQQSFNAEGKGVKMTITGGHVFYDYFCQPDAPNFVAQTPRSFTIDSLIVNGITYYDVVEARGANTVFYFKANIGLIRRVGVPIGTTYDLINYQVNMIERPK